MPQTGIGRCCANWFTQDKNHPNKQKQKSKSACTIDMNSNWSNPKIPGLSRNEEKGTASQGIVSFFKTQVVLGSFNKCAE